MNQDFRIRRPDIVLGIVLIGVGAGAATLSVGYDVGHLKAVGAGFFPLVVSALLGLCGLLIALSSTRSSDAVLEIPRHAVRSVLAIFGAIFVFAMSIDTLGLVPAIMLTVAVSAFGSYEGVGKHVLIVAVVVPLLCYLTFVVGLDLRIPAFQLGR